MNTNKSQIGCQGLKFDYSENTSPNMTKPVNQSEQGYEQSLSLLEKREKFAVSLRSKKKTNILQKKREANQGIGVYDKDIEWLDHKLQDLLNPQTKDIHGFAQFISTLN